MLEKQTIALSERELVCLTWAAKGKTIWETAKILSISERTVRFHLDNSKEKLSANNKVNAVFKATKHDLFRVED